MSAGGISVADSMQGEARDDASAGVRMSWKRLQQQFNFTTAQVNAPPEKVAACVSYGSCPGLPSHG